MAHTQSRYFPSINGLAHTSGALKLNREPLCTSFLPNLCWKYHFFSLLANIAKDDSKSPVRGGGGRISVTAPPSRKTSAANNVRTYKMSQKKSELSNEHFCNNDFRATRTNPSSSAHPSALRMTCIMLVVVGQFWAPPSLWEEQARQRPARPVWPICIVKAVDRRALAKILPTLQRARLKWPKLASPLIDGVDSGARHLRWFDLTNAKMKLKVHGKLDKFLFFSLSGYQDGSSGHSPGHLFSPGYSKVTSFGGFRGWRRSGRGY